MLKGAPIEGQEVSEADLLGKAISKDTDDEESIGNENDKHEGHMDDENGENNKRHADSEHSDTVKKKQKKEDGTEGSTSECETKAEKKLANMRRNIREVMDETQLDEATLSAQRQEMERLRRVQEQQRIIREVQRQIAINRQNNKTQTRVISLLQGKQNQAGTTISQSSSSTSIPVRLPNTVLLKVNSGSGTGSQTTSSMQTNQIQRKSVEASRWQKGRGIYQGVQTSISRVANRSTGPNMLQQRIRMMTPSVSISPVVPKKEPIDRSEYYSDSEISDIEAEEALREKQIHAAKKMSAGPKSQKTAKGKDVVTISSSSESSDDDCIVLSDPSGEEETDNEDDPSNSGMHTNDRYNIPDEHGRVLINVGHPETEPDVFLAPQVARIIKPHQIGGIRFLYDNIVESIERYKTSSGFGCILAHSMGLGKTLQVASFCDIFFRCTTAKTVLCIMPINTLQNWLAEFNMWLPYEDPNAPEKYSKGPGIKSESGLDLKQEVKDESGNQSDMSNMSSMSNISRPISTESAHRFGQENTSQSMNILPENSYVHQGYEGHNMMPGYVQDNMLNKNMSDSQVHMNENYHNDISQNALYNTNPNSMSNFDSMKSDINCRGMQQRLNMPDTKFSIENQNTGNIYSGLENRPQASMYPGMDTRNPGTLYHGVENHHSGSMYPNFDNSNTNTFPNYTNRSTQESDQELRKDCFKGNIPLINTEINVKKEPEDAVKKEESACTPKEEIISEERKDIEKVKTPFSVDACLGMDMRPRHFRLHILNDSHKTMTARAKIIQDWQAGGGVLLIGYELYRQLSLKKPNKAKRKRGQPFKDTVDVEEEDKNKGLLDDMHSALVNPGPDLVICDEGHRIKNSHASISMALKQMRTKRRIVLTGYPLQNNLLEYWCMVDFVRPNYLGTKSEFCNMFERPIQNGQCIDSTPQDIRLMRYRAHVLHALLEGFVQRRSHSVLQISLPRKEEYILLVRMTTHQRKLYDTFMNQVVKTRAVPNPLKAFAVCCKIWNHPDILYHFLRKRQANEEDDLDLEETIGEKPTPGGKRSKARQSKGESKKGKKANATIKNKPAASVQPNASSSSNTENVESDSSHAAPKQNNYSNYSSIPMNNSGYSNSVPQNSYPQGYQNYRSNDQNTYYRNDNNHGEYNEFYNNQGPQRYGNQSFQTYAQTSGYNTSQNYPNQPSNYIPNNEQSANNHSQRYPTAPPNSEFRPDQNQGNNYEVSGMFPRQSYPYQDHGRHYTSNINQGSNNYPQVPNQSTFQSQMPNQSANMPLPDYSPYTSNQTQNYNSTTTGQTNSMYSRNENQPLQTSTLGYGANQQSQNTTSQTPTAGYLPNQQGQTATSGQNRGFSPNQQNQSLPLQSSPHAYASSQNQTMPLSNQPHNYPTQVNSNPMSQNQSHSYIANSSSQASMQQSQIRGYPTAAQNQINVPQNSSSYPPGQSTSTTPTPTHGYTQDQQGSVSNSQNTMHGYSHLVSPSAPQNQSYSPNVQNQTGGAASANHAYGSNHQGSGTMPQTPTHRYGTSQQAQMPQPQNQSLPYAQNQQTSTSSINQNDQLYSRTDNQQQTQTYAPTASTPHEFSTDRQSGGSSANSANNYSVNQTSSQNTVLPNYSSDGAQQNQVNQIKGPEDSSYWQRNYSQSFQSDQCNDSYYRDVNPNVNRYQSNYFPSQNYQNQSYDYSNNHTSDINTRSDDSKSQQSASHIQNSVSSEKNKNNKEMTASVGVQSQPIHQNNLSSNSSYTSESNCQTPVSRSVQSLNSLHSPRLNQNDLTKEEEKDKEDILDKDKEDKSDDEILTKEEEKDCKSSPGGKEDPGIPYDWVNIIINIIISTFTSNSKF